MAIPAAQKNFWMDASGMNRAIGRGFKASAILTKKDAQARLKSKTKAGVVMPVLREDFALIKGTRLAAVFEKGHAGGYPIFPTGVDGIRGSYSPATRSDTYRVRSSRGGLQAQFLGGPFLEHPMTDVLGGRMRAYPALGPAASDWARTIGPESMRASCSAAGFSAARGFGL